MSSVSLPVDSRLFISSQVWGESQGSYRFLAARGGLHSFASHHSRVNCILLRRPDSNLLEAEQLCFASTSNYLWLPGSILARPSFLLVVHALWDHRHRIVCTGMRCGVCETLKSYRWECCDLCDRWDYGFSAPEIILMTKISLEKCQRHFIWLINVLPLLLLSP